MRSAIVKDILKQKQDVRKALAPVFLLSTREKVAIKVYEGIASKRLNDASLVAAIVDAQLERDLLSLNKRMRRLTLRKANRRKGSYEARSHRAARRFTDHYASARRRNRSDTLAAKKLARLSSMSDDVVVNELFSKEGAETIFDRLGSILQREPCSTASFRQASDNRASLEEIKPLANTPVFTKCLHQ